MMQLVLLFRELVLGGAGRWKIRMTMSTQVDGQLCLIPTTNLDYRCEGRWHKEVLPIPLEFYRMKAIGVMFPREDTNVQSLTSDGAFDIIQCSTKNHW